MLAAANHQVGIQTLVEAGAQVNAKNDDSADGGSLKR